MVVANIETAKRPWKLAESANSTNGSFSARTAQSSAPDVLTGAENHAVIVPFGTDADDETFDLRVIGWREIVSTGVWVPIHLGTLSITLSSTLTGVTDGTPNGTSDFFADTITVSAGTNNIDLIAGVADIAAASALIDLRGCQRFELEFALGTAASANALVALA